MNRGPRISPLCLVGCFLSVFARGGRSASPVPPFLHEGEHVGRIDTGDMLTLVERGKANVEIVVMTRAPLLRFAAEELQAFIAMATGVELSAATKAGPTRLVPMSPAPANSHLTFVIPCSLTFAARRS